MDKTEKILAQINTLVPILLTIVNMILLRVQAREIKKDRDKDYNHKIFMDNRDAYTEYYNLLTTILEKYRINYKNNVLDIESNYGIQYSGRFDFEATLASDLVYSNGDFSDSETYFNGISREDIDNLLNLINKNSENHYMIKYKFMLEELVWDHERTLFENSYITINDYYEGGEKHYSIFEKDQYEKPFYDVEKKIFKKAFDSRNNLIALFKLNGLLDEI